MGLMQQLRRRERRLVPVETSTTEQAVRFLADGTIDWRKLTVTCCTMRSSGMHGGRS